MRTAARARTTAIPHDGGNPGPGASTTITPGEGFSEEGNLVTRDLLYDEHTNKQFITVQTSGGNTFYIVIDYDKPVDEEGEQYETYFFSVVDEADLLAAAEAAGVEQAVCSCLGKMCGGGRQYGLRGLLCQYEKVRRRRAGTRAGDGACGGAGTREAEKQYRDAPAGAGCGWSWAAVQAGTSKFTARNIKKLPTRGGLQRGTGRTMTIRGR